MKQLGHANRGERNFFAGLEDERVPARDRHRKSGHLAHSAQAACSTKVLISEMMPISSASGMKIARRDGAEFGMVPAAQRLATGDAHRAHGHDRLIDDTQRLGFHGLRRSAFINCRLRNAASIAASNSRQPFLPRSLAL